MVAQGLAQLDLSGPQGNMSNPVVKLIFDCLAEQRKELNAAACTALGLVNGAGLGMFVLVRQPDTKRSLRQTDKIETRERIRVNSEQRPETTQELN